MLLQFLLTLSTLISFYCAAFLVVYRVVFSEITEREIIYSLCITGTLLVMGAVQAYLLQRRLRGKIMRLMPFKYFKMLTLFMRGFNEK